jgi:polysaccharide biosynthesis transport protein
VTSIVLRVLLVLVLAAVAGAAAVAFSNAQPKEYASAMRLGFGRLASPEFQLLGPGFSEPQVDDTVEINTDAAEVNSFDVAAATAKAAPDLHYNAGQVARAIDATGNRDTLIVTVLARASTPQRAARLANVYAQQFLALRRAGERKRATSVKRALRAQYRTLTKKEKASGRGGGLLAQMNTVEVLRRVGSGEPRIIDHARPSGAPASPNTLRNVLFGVLFGLAVGIGLVALRAETKNRGGGGGARRRGAAPARGDTVTPR